jgi:hypothetical protein
MRFLVVVSVVAATTVAAAQQPCTHLPDVVQLNAPLGPGGIYVDVRAGGSSPRVLQVDTGSTGIVIPSSYVGKSRPMPNPPPQNYIYYNSSGKAMCGRWVLTSVDISAGGTHVTIPEMPVLAVDYMCHPAPRDRCGCANRIEHLPDLGMFGVGFDRGEGMGGPDENPFLRLPQMEGSEGKPPTMQRGYVITPNGITLGISASAVQNFTLIPLTLAPQTTPPLPDWQRRRQARGCATVVGRGIAEPGNTTCGEILMDTGVDRMYLSYKVVANHVNLLPSFTPSLQAAGNFLWYCSAPDHAGDRTSTCESPGIPPPRVTVTWPDTGAPKFTFRTAAPQAFDWRGTAPVFVSVEGEQLQDAHENIFVNTSRQLLQTADYLYDATCGQIGFRSRSPDGGAR